MSFQSAVVCLDLSTNATGWQTEQRSWINVAPSRAVVDAGVVVGVPEAQAVAKISTAKNAKSVVVHRFFINSPIVSDLLCIDYKYFSLQIVKKIIRIY